MAEKKKTKTTKKETAKEYWKITCPDWVNPILRLKSVTSDRVLKSLKAKDGYKVEEA